MIMVDGFMHMLRSLMIVGAFAAYLGWKKHSDGVSKQTALY